MPQRNGYRSQRGRSAVARRVIMSGPAGSTNAIMSPLGYFGGMKKGGLAPSVPSLPVGARSLAGGRPPLVNHPHHQMHKNVAAKVTWESLGLAKTLPGLCVGTLGPSGQNNPPQISLAVQDWNTCGCLYPNSCRLSRVTSYLRGPKAGLWEVVQDSATCCGSIINVWSMTDGWSFKNIPNDTNTMNAWWKAAQDDLLSHSKNIKNLPVGHPAATMYHLPARGARAGVATLPGRH